MGQDTIIKILRKHGKMSKDDIISKSKLASSTVQFGLVRLDNKNMIDTVKIGRKIYYSLRG